ncbi:MAG: AraC family transcriptional regulator [Reinekea sp.]
MQNHEAIIQKVLVRIDDHLGDVRVADLIQYSGYSTYYFHRLFVAHVGESLKQYVKRLRLQKAAHLLNHSQQSVTEIALSAGYQTPSAFNKAFKEFFGTSPRGFKAQPLERRLTMKIQPVRIETVEPIPVYAARHVGPYDNSGQAWGKLMSFAYPLKIKEKKNLLGKESMMFGISYDDPSIVDPADLRYDACITADDDVRLPPGIEQKTIEGGLYAIFLHKGSYEGLGDTYEAIFASWVKDNQIALRDVPMFERYLNKDPRRTKPENLKTEIFVPIQAVPTEN